MPKPEIRKDYFRDNYVIIAPNRKSRPQELVKKTSPDDEPEVCFFCPETFANDVITYRDNNKDGQWEIIASVNKYPAVSLNNSRAYGQAEVIVETNEHHKSLNELSVEHIVRIFEAYINRYTVLKNITGIKHVIIFKNEGGKAGASIKHAHSQIVALPILPPKVAAELTAYDKYHLENGSCPYCDIITKESNGPRVIWQDKNLFVLAPFASESPYGAWLIPKRHILSIADLSAGEKESFAKALKLILSRLDSRQIPYNYFVENAVSGKDYHMHIKIAPRPNIWAGLELGTGVIINQVPPEEATKFYQAID